MERKTTLLLGLAVIAMLTIAACSPQAQTNTQSQQTSSEKVKIGYMGPLSGDAASYGIGVQRGIELAQAQSNAPIELITEDSQCDPTESVNVITKLITVDGVQAIIGELCSGATLAAAPIAEENGVVLISPASTSPEVSEAGEYIFRTVPSDAEQGKFAAELAYDDGHKKIASLYSNEAYGTGYSEVLVAEFTQLGGQVVANEAFERGATDLRSQLTKIRGAEPDAIFIITNSPDSASAALKQIAELGIDATLYGAEGLASPQVIQGAQGGAEGMFITSVSSGGEDFKQNHISSFGEEPGPFAAQGYDAYMVLANAVSAGATDGQSIRTHLHAMEYEGASGTIIFNAQGDVSGNYDILRVEKSEFVRQ